LPSALLFLVEFLFPTRAICDGFRVRDSAVGPMLRERGERVQFLHFDAESFEDVLGAFEPLCVVVAIAGPFD